MFGTNPNTDTNIRALGDSVLKISSKCSKSQDKSFKLQSHKTGSKPNNIGEDKSVAQLNEGTTTLLFFRRLVCFRAANVNKIDEDPEFTNTEYLVPNYLAHFSSNSRVRFPLVSLGISS
jgi:hypothetical protein